jgi:hypothetical protein
MTPSGIKPATFPGCFKTDFTYHGPSLEAKKLKISSNQGINFPHFTELEGSLPRSQEAAPFVPTISP